MKEQTLFDEDDGLEWLPPREVVNAKRDKAMQQVGQNAEDRRPSFSEEAQAFVVRYLEANGPTPGEVLSAECKRAGIEPHDDRAFGPVYMALSRRGAIEKVGECRRERGHGTAGGNIWGLRR